MLTLWLLSFCVTAFALFNPYPKGREVFGEGNVGNKLILTPYIESGRIKEARQLALVPPLTGNITSYSGYLTVNAKCQSNLFFWIFPAESNDPEVPLTVWLQGGPGATSLYGLFSELGPYELTPDNKLIERKYSWSRSTTLVFIDNPVGTGYSYTENEACYARNQTDVGRDLLNAVKQILKLFPEYSRNPFFVTGESYGGKYVPALSYAIHKDKDTSQKINLKGLAIGNGFVDPVNQLDYSDYLYQISLLDRNEKAIMKKQEDRCRDLIVAQKWKEAFICFDQLIDGDMESAPTYFKNVTGFDYYYNFLYAKDQPEGNLTEFITKKEVSYAPTYFKNVTGFDYYYNFLYAKDQPEGNLTEFITKKEIRKSIHVGNATWNNETLVEFYLMEDVAKSTRSWLEELLEHYRVLIYSGQLDIIVAHPLTENYLQKLKWSAANEFKNSTRHIWWVDSEVAGYAKTAGKLTVVLVRNAGHMVPMDQPKWAFDLISRFFKNKPFF